MSTMSIKVKAGELSDVIERELTIYSENIVNGVNEAGRRNIKNLVSKTKATAPQKSGDFKRSITSKALDAGNGMKSFVWYVKAPDYRLTHLLVHGHVTRNGGRTRADPFLSDAWTDVSESYQREVEEAIRNA